MTISTPHQILELFNSLSPGEWAVYYTGSIVYDRGREPSNPNHLDLWKMAKMVRELEREGLVVLCSKRIDHHHYQYWMVKRKLIWGKAPKKVVEIADNISAVARLRGEE